MFTVHQAHNTSTVECIAMNFKTHGDRRWWLARHATCNSSQAAKQRCSSDERKILVVVTLTHTVKATRYSVPQFHNMRSYSNCMCSGRNSGFEDRGACMSIIQLWLEVCWIPNSWSEIPFKVIWFLGQERMRSWRCKSFQFVPLCRAMKLLGCDLIWNYPAHASSPWYSQYFIIFQNICTLLPGCPADVVTFVWPNPDSVLQTRFLHLKSCFLLFYFLDKSVEAKNVGAGTTDVSLLLVEDGIFESLVSLASALFTKSKYYSCVLDFKLWCLSDVAPLSEGWGFIYYIWYVILYNVYFSCYSWLLLDRSSGHFIHLFIFNHICG